MGGHITLVGHIRNAYTILILKPEGKKQLGRPRSRWEDNIRMNVKEIGCEGIEWIHLAQNRVQWQAPMNTVMNLWVP
jgi:hypothetical protein